MTAYLKQGAFVSLLSLSLAAHAAGEKEFVATTRYMKTSTSADADEHFGTRADLGLVVDQSYDTLSAPVTAKFYRPVGSKIFVSLGNNLSGLNTYLKGELTDAEYARTFLKESMIGFLWDNLVGLSASHIDSLVVKQYEGWASRQSNVAPTVEILRRYQATPAVVVSGNSWSVEMPYAARDGSVGRWRVTGSTDPVRIKTIQQEQLAEAGATLSVLTPD